MGDSDFINIRIKKSDHKRLTKLVTHETKIHDLITEAVDLLLSKRK